MFRRSKSEPSPTGATVTSAAHGDGDSPRPGAKGRPTPSRREAEAARRARARTPRTRKELAEVRRAARVEQSERVRRGMRTGNDADLLPRDRGPVRRFLRDFVDSRLTFLELMMPLLVLSLVLSMTGNTYLETTSANMMPLLLLLAIVDGVAMRFRVRRQLKQRFPDESWKGTTYYAVMRALQVRFLRMPKRQVTLGQELPEHYR